MSNTLGMGSIVKPGVSVGTRNIEIPLFPAELGSVRARRKQYSASAA